MTIHYHGTPITPRSRLRLLAGHNFCVSFADPRDVDVVHQIGQSVMLDNGAYSIWQGTGRPKENWFPYYDFCDKWLSYQTTWAVIPDVIEGCEYENDGLVREWPHGERGAPVWHLHESLDRLKMLSHSFYRICFGSSAEYRVLYTPKWMRRVSDAFDAITENGRVSNWVHMLRGMDCCGTHFPFASVDSTDVARNWKDGKGHVSGDPDARAHRWDGMQCPGIWVRQATQPCIEYEPVVQA